MQNMTCTLKVRFVSERARAVYDADGGPAYATPASAGMDLRAVLPEGIPSVDIAAGERLLVPSGIAIEPQEAHAAGFVYSRSGLGAKLGLTVAQGVGVIDPDYRGEIMVMLLNTSQETRSLAAGERMAQLVLQPVLRAAIDITDVLHDTARGAGGFGHTGKI